MSYIQNLKSLVEIMFLTWRRLAAEVAASPTQGEMLEEKPLGRKEMPGRLVGWRRVKERSGEL